MKMAEITQGQGAAACAHSSASCTSTQPSTTTTTYQPSTLKTLSLTDFDNLTTRPQFLRDLRHSMITFGTFYIKDHGIPSSVTQGSMDAIRDYFALPLTEKKKMLIGNSRHFRGYKVMGEEFTNNQVDHREQLQFAADKSPVQNFIPSLSPNYHGLEGPNQWPVSTLQLLPEFKNQITDLMNHLEQLSWKLLQAMSLSLGLDQSYLKEMFGNTENATGNGASSDPYYRLKCARYPSVNKDATIGCGAHKDTGFLTLLLQDMVGGLQGQDPETNAWLDTVPVPDTFIVTAGESLERLTGGLYQATVHRVLNNTSGQDRYSIPFFFDPALDAKIPLILPLTNHDQDEQDIQDLVSKFEHSSVSSSSSCPKQQQRLPTFQSLIKNNEQGWSNGDHVFETVHRCHPEVFDAWYTREC